MKQFGRLFCIEFQRAIFSKRFAISILLMVVMEMVSSGLMIIQPDIAIVEIVKTLFDATGSAFVILCLIPLLPFSLSYAKDMEENALNFYMVRTNTISFMINRFLVACLSAFLCVVFSFFLFILILYGIGNLSFLDANGYHSSGYIYEQFLCDGNIMAYLLCFVADRGLSAAMMAACAVWISTMISNEFFTFVAPVCIYFLALRVIRFPNELEHRYLLVSAWIEGTYISPEGAIPSFLCKLGVAILVCTVYGGLSLFRVMRRWHYE